jgi:hypothetical protein
LPAPPPSYSNSKETVDLPLGSVTLDLMLVLLDRAPLTESRRYGLHRLAEDTGRGAARCKARSRGMGRRSSQKQWEDVDG